MTAFNLSVLCFVVLKSNWHCGKVIFSHASVSHSVHGGRRVWRGGACMVGGMRGRGVCVACIPPARYYEIRSMSGRYASYWNAFLLLFKKTILHNVRWNISDVSFEYWIFILCIDILYSEVTIWRFSSAVSCIQTNCHTCLKEHMLLLLVWKIFP